MKSLIIVIAACMFAGAASAQQLSLVSSNGEEVVFEMTENDPFKAPALYASAVLFNNTGFSGSTGTCAGAGADIQYIFRNRLKLGGYWMQGLVTSPLAEGGYVSWEASAAWYFNSTVADAEKMTRMKSNEQPGVHAFAVPARTSRLTGTRVGFNSSGMPLITFTSDDLSSYNARVTYVSTSSFIAGITFAESSSFKVSSSIYGSKLHCVRNTFYVDGLWASATSVELINAPAADGNSQPLEYVKYGGRIGYERASVLKRSGLGSFYRLEAGYRPGLKAYDAGVYMKVHAGICFGYKSKVRAKTRN